MYKEKDIVVYGRMGVCLIEKIEEKSFLGKSNYDNLCYVLKPVFDSTSTVYVPVNNEKLVSMMRPVLKKNEIDEMLDGVKGVQAEWITEQRDRTSHFRSVISGGTNENLIIMINCILAHKKEQASMGKKISSSDDEILKEAKREVGREFAFSLGLNEEEVENYITSRLGITKN